MARKEAVYVAYGRKGRCELLYGPAAVYEYGLAGHVARSLGSKEDGCAGKLVLITDSAKADLAQIPVEVVGDGQVISVYVGSNASRRDRVHQDVVLCPFHGQHPGKLVYAALAGAVWRKLILSHHGANG